MKLLNIFEDIISKKKLKCCRDDDIRAEKQSLLIVQYSRTGKKLYFTHAVHTVQIFQDFVGCEPVFTGTVGEYELNLFFTKLLADVDVGDQIDVILTATVSC